MIAKAEKAEVPPIAGVKFLRLHDQHVVPAGGVPARMEVADVGNPLLLVDDKVEDGVETLRARLLPQILRRVPVMPAVVHVHVQIGAAPRSK